MAETSTRELDPYKKIHKTIDTEIHHTGTEAVLRRLRSIGTALGSQFDAEISQTNIMVDYYLSYYTLG